MVDMNLSLGNPATPKRCGVLPATTTTATTTGPALSFRRTRARLSAANNRRGGAAGCGALEASSQMPARLGPRDAWVFLLQRFLGRTDNHILYSFEHRVLAPEPFAFLPCVEKNVLLFVHMAIAPIIVGTGVETSWGTWGRATSAKAHARLSQCAAMLAFQIDKRLPELIIVSTPDNRDDAAWQGPPHQDPQTHGTPVCGSNTRVVSQIEASGSSPCA
jgi:hypothetical protein